MMGGLVESLLYLFLLLAKITGYFRIYPHYIINSNRLMANTFLKIMLKPYRARINRNMFGKSSPVNYSETSTK